MLLSSSLRAAVCRGIRTPHRKPITQAFNFANAKHTQCGAFVSTLNNFSTSGTHPLRGPIPSSSESTTPPDHIIPPTTATTTVTAPSDEPQYDTATLPVVNTRSKKTQNQRHRLVILGAGWAGFRMLKSIDLNYYDVSVISPRNHFVFTPLLASACSGTLSFRSIIEPIRRARRPSPFSRLMSLPLMSLFARREPDPEDTAFRYYEASCQRIDTAEQRLVCAPNHAADGAFALEYDTLVVAVGNDVNDYGIPGVRQHCLFLKEVWDARRIRQRLIECFERASNPSTPLFRRDQLLHFVIVGAGPTGIETAAEIHDLIEADLRRLYPSSVYRDVEITVLEAGDTVLSTFDSSLQRYTSRKFARHGIRVHTRAKVVEVADEGTVKLADGTVIQCGMVLWSAGIGPRQLLAKEQKSPHLPKDKQSRLMVDGRMRVQGIPHVFALGDCSHIGDHPLPATAQVAQQQGAYLAQYLNTLARMRQTARDSGEKREGQRELSNEEEEEEQGAMAAADDLVPPFAYQHRGLMAYIGDYEAVTDVAGLKSGGFFSFLLWRSAYLTKLVSVKNKIMVPLDWMHTFVFGRDMSQF